jgi:hypothetical protein
MAEEGNIAAHPATAQVTDIHPASMGLAVAAGIGAAVAGAILWAVVTVLSEYELGVMAIAVGYMVGKAIIGVAKHGNNTLGVIGAVCSLFGCLLGNLLSAVGFASEALHRSYFDVLSHLNPEAVVRLFSATFGAMDLLFYAIAIYEGYRFASRG